MKSTNYPECPISMKRNTNLLSPFYLKLIAFFYVQETVTNFFFFENSSEYLSHCMLQPTKMSRKAILRHNSHLSITSSSRSSDPCACIHKTNMYHQYVAVPYNVQGIRNYKTSMKLLVSHTANWSC